MLFAIWYHLYNLKNVKNTNRGVLPLVKLQTSAYSFTKTHLPWVFFTFFKLCKWYQIAQTASHVPFKHDIDETVLECLIGTIMSSVMVSHQLWLLFYSEIPMLPTIVARISFQDFLWTDEIEDSLFQIPEDFKVTIFL